MSEVIDTFVTLILSAVAGIAIAWAWLDEMEERRGK